jgi:hypothetical protein
MAARTIPASPLGLPPRHDSSPMEAVGLSKGASPPTPNLLSQVLGKKSTREVLHALHDLTHFGLCELEMLLQQFNRLRANAGHKINKATFVRELGHAFGIADQVCPLFALPRLARVYDDTCAYPPALMTHRLDHRAVGKSEGSSSCPHVEPIWDTAGNVYGYIRQCIGNWAVVAVLWAKRHLARVSC